MAQTRFESDLYVIGNLSAYSMTIPAGTVDDAAVKAGAAIASTKVQHEHRQVFQQSGTAADDGAAVHYVRGATGTVLEFRAGALTVAAGNATVTVDLQKSSDGGAFASILSAPISLSSSDTAAKTTAATVTTAAVTAKDLLKVVITTTAGTGTLPSDVFAVLSIAEAGQ